MKTKNNLEIKSSVISRLNRIRISPKKIYPIIRLLRKKRGYLSLDKSFSILYRVNRRGSKFLVQLLRSAVANAINNNKVVSSEVLTIRQITVSHSRPLKRRMIRAKGASNVIKHRFSNLYVKLIEYN